MKTKSGDFVLPGDSLGVTEEFVPAEWTYDDEGKIRTHKNLGLVNEIFEQFDFSKLPGRSAVGHVRYTTAGGNLLANVQPFEAELCIGPVAVAHNGNLINVDSLKNELVSKGSIFRTTSDTELFLHLNCPFCHLPCFIPIIPSILRVMYESSPTHAG